MKAPRAPLHVTLAGTSRASHESQLCISSSRMNQGKVPLPMSHVPPAEPRGAPGPSWLPPGKGVHFLLLLSLLTLLSSLSPLPAWDFSVHYYSPEMLAKKCRFLAPAMRFIRASWGHGIMRQVDRSFICRIPFGCLVWSQASVKVKEQTATRTEVI